MKGLGSFCKQFASPPDNNKEQHAARTAFEPLTESARGLNRSTITALYKETTTRVDLPAVDQLCRLFNCEVGDLFEHVPDDREVNP